MLWLTLIWHEWAGFEVQPLAGARADFLDVVSEGVASVFAAIQTDTLVKCCVVSALVSHDLFVSVQERVNEKVHGSLVGTLQRLLEGCKTDRSKTRTSNNSYPPDAATVSSSSHSLSHSFSRHWRRIGFYWKWDSSYFCASSCIIMVFCSILFAHRLIRTACPSHDYSSRFCLITYLKPNQLMHFTWRRLLTACRHELGRVDSIRDY